MIVGKVYLVGAGPGDPGLLTLKGAECLQKADVVVYDRLGVSPELLKLAPNHANLIFMGKDSGTPAEYQRQISAKLTSAALAGKCVVRLKGGDPFVFGRGGEEIDALIKADIPYEIVPGVTSAISVPAYAGVPVTHRGLSTSFTVVTGSEDPTKPNTDTDWATLAKMHGTLVILMGWKNLPGIIECLIDNGKSPDTPVLVTQWGTTPKQKSVTGTLSDIVERGNAAGLSTPIITVVGDVAALHERMRWFENTPLFGMRVLVTRSRQQASELSARLISNGAEPIELPTIQIEPLVDFSQVDASIDQLALNEWAIFTSTNAVESFFNRLIARNLDSRTFASVQICAVGSATSNSLRKRGLTPDLVADTYSISGIVEKFHQIELEGQRVFIPRADIASATLPDALERMGAVVEEVVVYRNIVPTGSAALARELLSGDRIDAVTFTSSSTVRNLLGLIDGNVELLANAYTVSIGPVTTETARSLGLRIDIEATQATVGGMVDAMIARMFIEHGAKS